MNQSISIYEIPKKWIPIFITHNTKKKILSRISQIYNLVDKSLLSNIFIVKNTIEINKKLLDTNIAIIQNNQLINESTVETPYTFSNEYKNHVYANHANVKIGGGMFSFGFVQEEQLLIKSTLLFPIYNSIYCSENDLDKVNLERNNLLARCNIFVHQNTNMNLYGGSGMTTIKENPQILAQFYKPHISNPKIFILSKAIPIFRDTYKTFVYNGVSIIDWIFYSAYYSYLSTIETLDKCEDVDEIVIHDGNWGCGIYNHNVNTIYTILHLAFRAVSAHTATAKKKSFVYHTYDHGTYEKIFAARNLLSEIDQHATVQSVLEKIKNYHTNNDPIWSVKI